MTLNNGKAPPVASAADFSHGNADGTLFTILWPTGTVTFAPHGPGVIGPDGSLAMKWPWYRHTVSGPIGVTGQRLDAPAGPARAEFPAGAGDSGWTPSSLVFASEGCWEITARVGDATLTFVTLVIDASR